MSEYIGEVGKRISITATLINDYSFTSYYGRMPQETTIYTFKDKDNNVFCWKTSGSLGMDKTDKRDNYYREFVRRGDTFTCKATVKEHSEYKGTKQTVLTRIKVESITHIPTKEELEEVKASEQRASLTGNDFIWRMSYKQYKEHYSDCETVAGSFQRDSYKDSSIEVIIREGRLVPSGVRGKHYSGYQFKTNKGTLVCYRAVSEENAKRQLLKEFPNGSDWECVKIFNYR